MTHAPGEPHVELLGCRLASAHAAEVKKLGVRGTLANGVAKVESVKAAHPPPVWFVFSGAQPRCCIARLSLLALPRSTGVPPLPSAACWLCSALPSALGKRACC